MEISPRFDLWMRGDRYGTVEKHSERFGVYVKMDKSGKVLRYAPEDLTSLETLMRNPATPQARRYVAKKITRLAREGVPPEQRVAAALSMARRAGYRSVPKRPRKANPFSEKTAWERVLKIAGTLQRLGGNRLTDPVAGAGRDLASTAHIMLTQLAKGVHENPRQRSNPALALIANESPAVFTVSTRVKEIVYIHSQDGEEYVHPFAAGVSATFLQDGRCVLWRKDGKPVGGRRIGNTIRPIGG